MGLSSSKSKTTTNTNQKTNETTSGTQTPITPPWLTQAAQDYVGRIGAFGEMDPNSFVARASPLQQAVWQNAIPALSGWQPQMATASQQALAAGQGGANMAGPAALMSAAQGTAPTATATGFRAPSMRNASIMQASRVDAPRLGAAPQQQATGYNAPTIGANQLVSGQGYTIPDLADAQGYGAARAGQPIGADTSSVAANMGAYGNSYDQQVIDASLAQHDRDTGAQRAALAAQGARSGAFGGSRFGIAEGQLAADAALGRSSLGAGLRQQGFREAAQLGRIDATARNQANLRNADSANRFALDQAARQDAASQFTAGARNQFGLAQAGLAENAGQFNAAQRMQAGLANQQAGLQRNLAQAGLQADAGQFGAAARNLASGANADRAGQFALQQGSMGLQAGLANQGAINQARAANMDARNTRAAQQAQMQFGAAQFGAGAQNAASLANQGMAGQFGLANMDAANQAAAQNAAAQNQFALFNAGQQDNAAQRQLASAQLLGGMANDFGAGTRADLGTMAQLGDQQRGVEQQFAMAPLAQLEMMGQLSGMTPYDILVGRQIQGNRAGTMTGSGTSVTRSSPSLFDQLLQGANAAARFL